MPSSNRDRSIAVLCTLASMLCFSSVPIFLRFFTKYLDFWTVNAVRYSVAAVFWLPFVVVLGRRFRAGEIRPAGDGHENLPTRSVWVAAIVPAAVNIVGQIGWAISPYYATASTVGFVIRTSFLFTILMGFVFVPAERRLGRQAGFYVGAIVSLAGVTLMAAGRTTQAGPADRTTLLGVALLIGTAVFWGAYAATVRRFMAGYPLRLAFGVISLYTAVTLGLLMLGFGRYEQLADLPAKIWILLALSGFIGIAISHVLYYRGIHNLGPVVANGITLAGPFVTALAAVVVLDESMTIMQLIGGVTVVAGGGVLVWVKGVVDKARREPPLAPS